jgi:hypothetical protein
VPERDSRDSSLQLRTVIKELKHPRSRRGETLAS